MAISSRLGTFGERRIQSNPKWKDYHYSTICSQILAYCLYCREGIRTYKKKLDDRTCMYCEKEFKYPSVLKRHLRLKNICSKQVSQATDQISQTASQANQTTGRVSNQVSLTSDQISNQINEKNTVP